MSNFITEHRDEIIIYLTLHSYSQTWLMPWNAAKGKSNDYDDLLYMGRKAIESLKKTHGTNYNIVAKTTSYPTAGKKATLVNNSIVLNIFTIFLLGRSRSGVPFQTVFLILVALSLGAILQLRNTTPGRGEARVVGKNTQKQDNKKNYKTILSTVLSHLRIFNQ